MARATASCGPGCALPASAPAGAAFCGSCARSGCWSTSVPAARFAGPGWRDHYRAGGCHVGHRPDLGRDWRGPAATPIAPSPPPVKQAVRQCHGASLRGSPLAFGSATITAVSTSAFQAESRFLRTDGLPAFAGEPDGNGCSCYGSAASAPLGNCAWRFSPYDRPTANPGSSSGMTTGQPPRPGPGRPRPYPWPLERRAVAQNCGPAAPWPHPCGQTAPVSAQAAIRAPNCAPACPVRAPGPVPGPSPSRRASCAPSARSGPPCSCRHCGRDP